MYRTDVLLQVNDNKKASEKVREFESLYDTIITSLPLPLTSIEQHFAPFFVLHKYVNQISERLFKYGPEAYSKLKLPQLKKKINLSMPEECRYQAIIMRLVIPFVASFPMNIKCEKIRYES